MKLKNKLVISFCIMVFLPVILCSLAMGCLYHIQKESIERTYEVEDGAVLIGVYSPIMIFGGITDGIYEDMKVKVEENPAQFADTGYLDELSQELSAKLSCLVVRVNGRIIYNSTSLPNADIRKILPEYSDTKENISDVGTYKGGEYQNLIKQLNFRDSEGNYYSVSIVTSLKQILPQIKAFIVEVIMVIIFVLMITSLGLTLWIYSSIVRPLNKLKLATNNIKEGNMDFEMPKVSNNEIGDVCRDFEDMRVILKNSSEEKLKSDVEEKELIRNISHDLKTPLTAIKGYVEGLQDGVANTPEKQAKYIQTIANKVNDMDKLIDELTIYSRLDTNRVPYTFVRCNVSDYFGDCCEEIGTELEASQIGLEYNDHLTEPAYMNVDPEQLKRVVNNIISNSVKYMAEGRQGRITIDLYDEGDYIHVIFSDNGIGIAAKDIEHVFERFYRTDESRNSKHGGSGIGLAIVKKIVEDHKGKIWAESVEGEGTTMHLNLIKAKAENNNAQEA
ncbi:MAG: HAMP domain-containing sensor histidine kinase [Lachnospira sp.]|nr:HAMP domain-containing sensor histidine kinase [Lachnospira sp.]